MCAIKCVCACAGWHLAQALHVGSCLGLLVTLPLSSAPAVRVYNNECISSEFGAMSAD